MSDGYDIAPAPDPDLDHDTESSERADLQPDAVTAFLVVVRPDGSAYATPEISNITIDHQASLEEMHRAVREVEEDISTARISQNVVLLMQQQAMAMAQAQQEAQLRAQLAGGGLQPGAPSPFLRR